MKICDLKTIILAFASADAIFVTLQTKMRFDQAEKACIGNGMILARVTKSNLPLVSAAVMNADKDVAWVASYNGQVPKKSAMLLRAGEPTTISVIKKRYLKKTRHVAVCEMPVKVKKDKKIESSSNSTSETSSSTTESSTTKDKPVKKRHHRRAYSSSSYSSTSTSTRSSEARYLRRLRKYRPPQHVNTGIKSFKFPENKTIRKRSNIRSRAPSLKRKIRRTRRDTSTTTSSYTTSSYSRSSFSTSSYSSSSSGMRCKTRKCRKSAPKRRCHKNDKPMKKKCRRNENKKCHKPTKRCNRSGRRGGFLPFGSHSSSSSHSRRISLSVRFSEEDCAILGSCDKPAIAFHHRHYSRRFHRSSESRSRSRSRL